MLNHSAEIIYKETNDRVSVMQRYYGLDVFDQLKLEMQISGRIPPYEFENKLVINDYQTQFNFIASGKFAFLNHRIIIFHWDVDFYCLFILIRIFFVIKVYDDMIIANYTFSVNDRHSFFFWKDDVSA